MTSSAVVASDIRLAEEADGIALRCRLRGPGLPEHLWFRVERDLAHALAPTGDAFLPPLLLAAMQRGVPLILEGDVSAALLATAPHIMDIFEHWSGVIGRPLRPVPVEGTAVRREVLGVGVGAFFSGGIDSFYTVLRNERHPGGDSRRTTHLILMHGFDIRLDDNGLFREVEGRLGMAARELGKVLIAVQTNAKDVVAALPWGYTHGAVMASVGLALSRLLRTCLIAGSNSIRHTGAWGTHPGLDQLWSTEALEFVHDSAVLGKLVKAPLVVSSPVALRTLRVCWRNHGGTYNCGRCEKCLRTMLLLVLCEALGKVETLPAKMDLDTVARAQITPYMLGLWMDLRRRIATDGRHPALVAALDLAIGRSRLNHSRIGRAEARVVRWLSASGVTPTRIKRLLGARGVRTLRRLRGV